MFNIKDALYASKILGIQFDKFTLDDFLLGLNIELEHGLINPKTNVTNNDLILTAKIALAHLEEFPNYYNSVYGLTNFEKILYQNLKKINIK